MNTDTHYEPADPVDLIIAQERFEESDEYAGLLREWMVDDDITLNIGAARFYVSAQYDVGFQSWLANR